MSHCATIVSHSDRHTESAARALPVRDFPARLPSVAIATQARTPRQRFLSS